MRPLSAKDGIYDITLDWTLARSTNQSCVPGNASEMNDFMMLYAEQSTLAWLAQHHESEMGSCDDDPTNGSATVVRTSSSLGPGRLKSRDGCSTR